MAGESVAKVRAEDVRVVTKRDFIRNIEGAPTRWLTFSLSPNCVWSVLPVIRPSVSKTSLREFEDWNREYGCTA